jgi:hypothetical protein
MNSELGQTATADLRRETVRGLLAGGIALTLVALLISPATAQSSADAAKKQLKTAILHAGELAQKGTVAAESLTHVQHVMNCLEGPGGKHFKADAGYPCKGQGNGILNDLQAAVTAGAPGASKALPHAKAAHGNAMTVLGYTKEAKAFTEVAAIQGWAKNIAKELQLASDALK